jgi:hypothetical protein
MILVILAHELAFNNFRNFIPTQFWYWVLFKTFIFAIHFYTLQRTWLGSVIKSIMCNELGGGIYRNVVNREVKKVQGECWKKKKRENIENGDRLGI